MKKGLKQAISIILCGGIAIPYGAFAEDNKYIQETTALLTKMRELAPIEATSKFNTILLGYKAGIKDVTNITLNNVNAYNEDISKKFTPKIERVNKLSQTFSLENFKQILQTIFEIRNLVPKLNSYKNNLDYVANWLQQNSDASFYTDFCNQIVPLLDPSTIRMLPMNEFVSSVRFTKYGSMFSTGNSDEHGYFSADPVVDTVSLYAAGGVIGGIITYAVVQGTANSIFSLGAISGAGIAVGISGPAAGIVLIGLTVIAVGSWLATEFRNKEKQKDAEKEIEKQQRLFEEARTYYEANKINKEEFYIIGRNICDNMELAIDNNKLNFLATVTEFQKTYSDFSSSYESISKIMNSLDVLLDNYKRQLTASIAAEYVTTTQKQILEEANIQAAINHYNINVKPMSDDFDNYMLNEHECKDLITIRDSLLGILDTHKTVELSSTNENKIPTVVRGFAALSNHITANVQCDLGTNGGIYDF